MPYIVHAIVCRLPPDQAFRHGKRGPPDSGPPPPPVPFPHLLVYNLIVHSLGWLVCHLSGDTICYLLALSPHLASLVRSCGPRALPLRTDMRTECPNGDAPLRASALAIDCSRVRRATHVAHVAQSSIIRGRFRLRQELQQDSE